MNNLWNNIRMFLWLTCLTGIIYPLLITMIVQVAMNQKANGGFLASKETIVGSSLIAQKFESDRYFWPRPSAVDFNPLPSGGSNLGPTSAELKKVVEERREKMLMTHHSEKDEIPAELLFASGSGLDPHINVSTAYFQMDRVAKSRAMDKKEIQDLIDSMVINRKWGFLGEACVNVLQLNMALDQRSEESP